MGPLIGDELWNFARHISLWTLRGEHSWGLYVFVVTSTSLFRWLVEYSWQNVFRHPSLPWDLQKDDFPCKNNSFEWYKRIRVFFLQISEDLIQNNPHHVLNTYLYLILLLKIIVLTLLNDSLLGNFWFFEKTSFLLFKFFCRRSRKFNLNKIINIIYFFSIIHLCIWRFLNFFICKINLYL